jgi:hypothetical protein
MNLCKRHVMQNDLTEIRLLYIQSSGSNVKHAVFEPWKMIWRPLNASFSSG